MKEAAGEANMTTITIMLIGAIAAVAIPMINRTMSTAKKRAQCISCGGYVLDRYCVDFSDTIIDPRTCEYTNGEYDDMFIY